MVRTGLIVILVGMAGRTASAQVVVQQPVVGQTSVSTTVTVPDRGSMFLGGTASAQAGRVQGGPLRSGTSSGLAYQSSSITTQVTIHDLQGMDEAILRSRPGSGDNLSRDALVSRIQKAREKPSIPKDDQSREKAAKFEVLAQNAEKAGKPGVAKVFWQSAAKCGSTIAEKRLAQLARPAPSPPVASTYGR